jgi:hypothetical protein
MLRATSLLAGALMAMTLVLTVSALLPVPEACAQARKVKDRRLRDRTAREIERRNAEIVLKIWELEEMLRQAEGLVTLAERVLSVRDIRDAVDVYVGGGDILGYGTADLERLYNDIMIASALPADFEAYFESSAAVMLDTYQNLLLAVREQMSTIETSESTIERLRRQVEDEATNQMKALQMQSAVELFKAEELMLLRQALAIQANAQAVMGAYASNQEAIEVGILRRALEGE